MNLKKVLSAFTASLIAIGSAIAAYVYFIRPWHLRWGSSDNETDQRLPGDDFVRNPKLQATHAVDIQAKPEDVWPWLVQIGQGRGGFYSYDWIENMGGLDIRSADNIIEEHQDLKVGDIIPLAPDGFGLPVAIIEPGKILVLHGDTRIEGGGEQPLMRPGDYLAGSWGFYLFPKNDGTTRLVERFRADWNEAPYNTLFYRAFLEPGAFIMERKMLLGIKSRAEAQSRMPSESEGAIQV